MSDGDEDAADEPEDETEDLDPETIESRLEAAADSLETAETEADLEDVGTSLDEIEADLESGDLPVPDEDEEENPAEALENRLAELRTDLEERQGPYPEDITETVGTAGEEIAGTRWSDGGIADLRLAVARFLIAVDEAIADYEADPVAVPAGVIGDVEDETVVTALETAPSEDAVADGASLQATLSDATDAIEAAALHPDDDPAALETLDAAATELADAVESAVAFDDLTVREQLQAEGFYDSLGQKHKDFPPEWSALKGWEQRDNAAMILLALEKMDSDFMERHCLEALERMGNPEAIDAMLERAERRDKPAIRVLGTTGVARDDVLETLHEFVDGDPGLQVVTLKTLGQIGAAASVQPVANQLSADEQRVRSQAARALGLIGDPRAIEPLADVLADPEEANPVRASAAWALVTIGTERALETAAEYADDPSYVVAAEAEPARDALTNASAPA